MPRTGQNDHLTTVRALIPGARLVPCSVSGFTLVELVGTLIIVGILAVAALPRFFDRSTFDARGFHDRVLSMVAYGQKTAVAQHRRVYVRLNGSSVALCFDSNCATHVRAPAGNNSAGSSDCSGDIDWHCVETPSGLSYSSPKSLFYFSALGKPFNSSDSEPNSTFTTPLDIAVTGDGETRQIRVEQETGYVHR